MNRRELLLGGLCVPLASACLPTTPGPSATAASTDAPLRQITIQVPNKGANLTWLYVTQDLGLFQKQGLQVNIVTMSPNTAAAALQSGEITFMTATGSAARAALQGLPVRVVLIAADRATYVLLGAKGISSIDDLRGKVVAAYSPQNSINTTTVELLRRKGLTADQYTLLNVGDDAARTAAVVANQAAATLLDLSAALKYLNGGYTALARGADIPQLPASGLAVSAATLSGDRQLVREVVQAVLAGLQVAATQQSTTVPIMAREFDLSAADAATVYTEMAAALAPTGEPSSAGMQLELESDQRDLELPDPIQPDRIYDFSVVREVRG